MQSHTLVQRANNEVILVLAADLAAMCHAEHIDFRIEGRAVVDVHWSLRSLMVPIF
jgi:hypothetical protein